MYVCTARSRIAFNFKGPRFVLSYFYIYLLNSDTIGYYINDHKCIVIFVNCVLTTDMTSVLIMKSLFIR